MNAELSEAYRDGILTAARMVRLFLGERYGENFALVIDVDECLQADKPTLIYVAESLERRAASVGRTRRAKTAQTGLVGTMSTRSAKPRRPNTVRLTTQGIQIMDEVISKTEEAPDIHQQTIQYLDVIAKRLAQQGRFGECAYLHQAANLLDRIKDQSHDD